MFALSFQLHRISHSYHCRNPGMKAYSSETLMSMEEIQIEENSLLEVFGVLNNVVFCFCQFFVVDF